MRNTLLLFTFFGILFSCKVTQVKKTSSNSKPLVYFEIDTIKTNLIKGQNFKVFFKLVNNSSDSLFVLDSKRDSKIDIDFFSLDFPCDVEYVWDVDEGEPSILAERDRMHFISIPPNSTFDYMTIDGQNYFLQCDTSTILKIIYDTSDKNKVENLINVHNENKNIESLYEKLSNIKIESSITNVKRIK
ncbi:hypothetical protein [Aquimarina macrocephali]|uniref:hypothetical protein n=1 Tax=Aquimarina macrocephali TaxID=666563 RepID=UPI0004669BA9|nr:hypothetical protein [Aquimarina macrocephali]